MRKSRLKAAFAAASALSAVLLLASAGTASADVPYEDYDKYVTIDGPQGLEVGGDWGVWTLHAKNPNATADTKDHLVFNSMPGGTDQEQMQFQVRAGTDGDWTDPQVQWSQMSSDPAYPVYLASIDVTGAALDLAPHADTVYQIRARQLPTGSATRPFSGGFSAFLTPQRWPDGQAGDFTARADTSVLPLGLTTSIEGLPDALPADGTTRQFTVHITTANQADWHLGAAGFFLWQGQTDGSMGGPSTCDAEVDVLDSATGAWHPVSLGAAGQDENTVDLSWAQGPVWDRTLTARITLGAGFKADQDASIGFGYYPGSGDPDQFWTSRPFTSTSVPGAPGCVTANPGSTFYAAGPTRVLDTRGAIGVTTRTPVAAGGIVRLALPADEPVPAGATAVVLNVTATQPTAAGVLIAYPDGKPRPTSSNLNWTAGETIPNQVVVPLGTGNTVDLYNHSSGTVHLIADVAGYYKDDTGGAMFSPAGPSRLLDTRSAIGVTTTTAVAPHATVHLQVAGQAGLPSRISGVVLNVTATAPTASGVLTVYPDDSDQPTASNLNWTAGTTIANHVTARVGYDGKVNFYNNSSGTVHIVADAFGYFFRQPAAGSFFHPLTPSRLMDTRSSTAVPAMGTRQLDLAGTAIPANATSAVLNVTATEPQTSGFLTVYPDGAPRPSSSNINWTAGETIPNLVTVPVVDGKILFFNHSGGNVQVIADAAGYYTD